MDVSNRGIILLVNDIENPEAMCIYGINDNGKLVESYTSIRTWKMDFSQAYEKVIKPFADFPGNYSINEKNEFAIIPKINEGEYNIEGKKLS